MFLQVLGTGCRSWGEIVFCLFRLSRVGDLCISFLKGEFEKSFGFVLWNMSPYELVERESLLFSAESLVAEFGGTLGLFLGFSFMALWDSLEVVAKLLGKLFAKS